MRSRPATSLQRHLAVEMEVPEVAQQPHRLPLADARQERIHQRDALDLGRKLRGIGIGDHEADIVAGEPHAPVAERRGERVDVLRHRLLVVALRRLGGLAEAAQIGRDHGVRLGQLGDQRPPHVAGLGVAVQQDHRLAVAGGEIVEPDAVDVGEAALDGRHLLCSRRSRQAESRDDETQIRRQRRSRPCHRIGLLMSGMRSRRGKVPACRGEVQRAAASELEGSDQAEIVEVLAATLLDGRSGEVVDVPGLELDAALPATPRRAAGTGR